MNRYQRGLLMVLLAQLYVPTLAQSDAPKREAPEKVLPPPANQEIDFVTDVQPILKGHCYECHAGDTLEGGLNLAVKASAMKGGDQGAIMRPGDSQASLLIQLVAGVDEDRLMPPAGNEPLSDEKIGVLRAWVDQGARWPESADVLDPRLDRARDHWAFQRLRKAHPPAKRKDDTWSKTNLDLFIKEKLLANDLEPSDPAPARTLVRRLYFNLVGLPPTVEQTEQFVETHSEDSAHATANLVEQLLSSRHYGERWARHWLDLARYADSAGQEADRDRPHAYRYRDFVIKSLNADMPYDQFVRWQIAGDEYEPENDAAVAATGFLTSGTSFKLGDTFLERERLLNRYNELDDIVSTVGSSLLGLSVGCARCHDHKYDAISAQEYYQLLAAFHSGDRVKEKLPSGADGFFFKDFDAQPRTTWLFRRSDFYDREIEVSLGFPAILSAGSNAAEYWAAAKSAVKHPTSTLQRRALADWITDVDQGGGTLLARVIVNRVWQHHFGYGLARTPSDFGVRGDPPTHPKLLEYLTNDFISNGWRIKRLHRMILTSAVWQQSSNGSPTRNRGLQVDPQNRLMWRMLPQRLEAEALRDSMLATSGTLNTQAGGPGFKPYIQPEANLARNIQGDAYPTNAKDDPSTRRRSIYMFHKRLIPYPLFQAFDRPDFLASCAQRQNTTVAPQAMALLNDRFVRDVARDFALRLLDENGDDDVLLIQQSFRRAFSRFPAANEAATANEFVRMQTAARQARGEKDARIEAVTDLCQSLFGLNEFIYVD